MHGSHTGIASVYVATHARRLLRGEELNLPRELIVWGTAVCWYVGIVAFNGDLAFTTTNVVAHAIPYMALVWVYGENREALLRPARRLFVLRCVPLLLSLLVVLAYLEEGLWDGLIWREHLRVFTAFSRLPAVDGVWADLLVPLLILPQLTHYVLDSFIWRLRQDSTWRQLLLLRRTGLNA